MKDFPLRLRHPLGQLMHLERDRVLVGLKRAKTSAEAADLLPRLGLMPEEAVEHAGAGVVDDQRLATRPRLLLNNTPTRIWARTADGSAFTASRISELRENGELDEVDWFGPVYKLESAQGADYLSNLPHVLVIKPANQVDPSTLAKQMRQHEAKEVPEKSEYLGDYHYYVIGNPLEATSFELLTELLERESGTVSEARFETMPMFVPTAYVPNDPLYPDQWNVQRIQAGGSGYTAWNISRGDPGVIVCVIDSGCDLTHPDLDYVSDGINLGTMAPTGAPTGNHGTACAGIAAANLHNAAGISGLAGDCLILPVAFDAWTDVEVAAGIRYGAMNGSRVLSMSFGWDPWDPAIIDPAIQDAFDLDAVMCVATHNHNDDITYPATNPLVMACGASDQVDERKSPTSPDGELWWGSNFGPEISVVAPGVLIPTTDRQGAVGYDPDDYFMMFNGTSSATPLVAGLAALLISCDASLSNIEVRNIIESTADKVGSVPYAIMLGYPNGSWNEEMGYGRINALRALQSVCKRLYIDWGPPDIKVYEEVFKLERYKEKERIDEVKGVIGYENPLFQDPTILERILQRLDQLERRIGGGRHFITKSERPEVGADLARRARVNPKAGDDYPGRG